MPTLNIPTGWGSFDQSGVIQAILDQDDGNGHTYQLPEGIVNCWQPLVVSTSNVSIVGVGQRQSTLFFSRWMPGLLFGVGASRIDPAHRHDVGPILDGTVKGRGFSTLGRARLWSSHNCTTIGQRHPRLGGDAHDYYGEFRAFTLQLAFTAKNLRPGDPILGLGNAEPWRLYVDGEGMFNLALTMEDPDNPYGKGLNRNIRFRLPDAEIWRLKIVVDFNTGEWRVYESNRMIAAMLAGGGNGLLGKLRPNRDGAAMWFGAEGYKIDPQSPAPDLRFHGVSVWCVPRWEPDLTDSACYQGQRTEGMVWYLGLDGDPTRRIVPIQGGPQGDTQYTAGVILDGGSGGVFSGYEVRDLRLFCGSSQIGVGHALDFSGERILGAGGACTLASVPMGAAYPIDLTRSITEGIDVAVDVQDTTLRLTQVDVHSFAGTTAVRARSADLLWQTGFIRFGSAQVETVVDFLEGDYGGDIDLANLVFDNEDHNSTIRRAYVRAEMTGYDHTSIAIRNLYSVYSEPGAAVIDLAGPANPNRKARINASGLKVSGELGYVVRVRGGAFTGVVDGTLCPAPMTLDGVAPGLIVLGMETPKPEPITPKPEPTEEVDGAKDQL